MRLFFVGGMKCGSHCPVEEVGGDMPEIKIGELVDFHRKHHDFCPSKGAWVPRDAPVQPSCCPPGDCRGACCGLTGVISNLPPLINAMIERRCDVVPAPMVKKYVGVALAHLTNGDNIDLPADVRGARAIRVLTEFITLVDPPKEPSCDVGCH